MLIYLVRHGQTDWNKMKKLQGQSDIPLNKYGIWLTEITAEGLKDVAFDRVYSSPLKRAVQTAEILTRGRNLPITEDPRLMEINFGSAEGMNVPMIGRLPFLRVHKCLCRPEKYTKAMRGGETFEAVEKRGMEFMNKVIKPLENSCDCILITSHGGVMRAIINSIAGIPRKEYWSATREKNCAVNRIECKDGIFRVLETGRLYYDIDTAAADFKSII